MKQNNLNMELGQKKKQENFLRNTKTWVQVTQFTFLELIGFFAYQTVIWFISIKFL